MNTSTDILKQTKQALEQELCGVFVLVGKEEYLKRNFISDIKAKVFADEMASAFDFNAFDGEDAYDAVCDASEQPPVISPTRVVLWQAPPVFDKTNEKKINTLCSLLQNSKDVLLILYVYPDGADMTDKAKAAKAASLGRLFRFDTLPKAKLYGWVRRHFAADGCEIDDGENAFLCDRVCCDMTRLADEITKLCAYMNETGQKKATRSMIERIVPAQIEFENFYLSGRIGAKDGEGVLKYFKQELAGGTDPIMLLGAFTAEVEKLARIKAGCMQGLAPALIAKMTGMHEYALKLKLNVLHSFKEKELEELLHECYLADAAMKSTSRDKGVILDTLACML